MNKKKSYGGVSLVSAENFYSMREGMNSKYTYSEIKTRRRCSLNSDRMPFDKSKHRYNCFDAVKCHNRRNDKVSTCNGFQQMEKQKQFHLKNVSSGFSKSVDHVENSANSNKYLKIKRKHSLSFSNDQTLSIDLNYAKDSSSTDSSAYASYEDLSDSDRCIKHTSVAHTCKRSNYKLEQTALFNNAMKHISSDKKMSDRRFVYQPVKWICNDLSAPNSHLQLNKKYLPVSFFTKNLDFSHLCAHCYRSKLNHEHQMRLNDLDLMKSSGHYIFHYSVDHPLTLYDYAFDNCPVCRPGGSPRNAKTSTTSELDQEPKSTNDKLDSKSGNNDENYRKLFNLCEQPHINSLNEVLPNEDLSNTNPIKNPSISFTFSSPPHPFKGNIFLDLKGADVQLFVERLSPVREIASKDRRQQFTPKDSSKRNSYLSSESLIFDNSYSQYFNPLCMYLLPEPIRCPRERDVFNSLKTCMVPPHEIRTYQMAQIPLRQWRQFTERSNEGISFTLLCYNVLCPSYATQTQYPYCPSWCLNWDYRRRGILEELEYYNADIICLQELETLDYEEVFKVELEKHQYDSVFLPKSRSRTMMETDSKNVDGCAIFWKHNMFEKVYEFHQEFMHSCTSLSENPAPILLNRVMNKDNIALGVIFKTKTLDHPTKHLCITTGHIHWNPEFSDVKLIQTIMWTTELRRHIESYLSSCEHSEKVSSSMPVIVCGDFNSLPDSGVVDYMMQGGVNCQHAEFRGLGTNYAFAEWKSLQKGLLDGDLLRHGFRFDRAYKDNQGMKWTNYTHDFRGMIDYIFFTKSHFRLTQSLDMIEESWFERQKILACPYVHNHSDHFSLLVELELYE